jgi:hypothetical protein
MTSAAFIQWTQNLILDDNVHKLLKKQLLLKSPVGVAVSLEKLLLNISLDRYSNLPASHKRFLTQLRAISKRKSSAKKTPLRKFLVRNLSKLSAVAHHAHGIKSTKQQQQQAPVEPEDTRGYSDPGVHAIDREESRR